MAERFIEVWRRHLQADRRLGALVQVGISASYPLFAHSGDGLFTRHFYYPSAQTGPNQVTLSAPRLLVTLTLPDLSFVQADSDPFGLPPFENSVYEVPDEQYEAKRLLLGEIEALYDAALQPFPEPPERTVGTQLLDKLHQVVPPALWPYYEWLAPDFFAWVDAA